ncbi:hypothetical protein HO173_001895 [Letharia columbiana]|uniref:Uncharacterized protein n=1 Tax=Letharia columbiana TaxID=112416 RepID=A0A8H6L933_9LECA|nr:uncharacterized protein HO173_001895 [Letharia columbiana]KAF6240284.1 hypothetical protein HO173_001895 [Letharia columbiana]
MSVRAPIVASHCQAGDEFKPIHTFTLIRYINGVVALSGRVFLQKITSAQGLLFTRWNIRGGVGEAPKVKSHPQILNRMMEICTPSSQVSPLGQLADFGTVVGISDAEKGQIKASIF